MAGAVTLDLEGWDEFKARHLESGGGAPALVEEQVIGRMAESMRMPAGSSGILLSSGTMANILGLAVARYCGCGFDVRKYGLYGGSRRLTVYGTSDTREWASKALELLGLGTESWRDVSMRDWRMDVGRLRRQLTMDRRGGLQPLCVIGTAGSAQTGVSDDLDEIAGICSEEGLWFHVDGGYGALAQWSERLQHRVAGIARADSLAFDLQKWGYQPFSVACLLARDADMHRNALASAAPSLSPARRVVAASGLPFLDLGVEPTREFRALEVWMSLKSHGARLLTSIIEQNVDQALRLASLVSAHPELELLVPTELNIVCFRYVPRGCANQPLLNALNEELLLRLQEEGNATLSSIALGDRFALRCAFVSQRTRPEDAACLATDVARVGNKLARERIS